MFGSNHTMYTSFLDVFFDDLAFTLVPLFVGLMLCVVFQGTWKGIWKIWFLLVFSTLGFIVGTLFDLQLPCTIIGAALYLLFQWKWGWKLLFGTWKKALITIAVLLVALLVFWLFF